MKDFKLHEYFPFQIFVGSALICKQLEKIYKSFDIENNKEWRVMILLYENERMNMKDISKASFMNPINVTRAVENLFQKDYCERFYDKKDRRRVDVEISDKGKHLIKNLIPYLKVFEESVRNECGDELLDSLSNNYKKLLQLSEDLTLNLKTQPEK